MASKGYNSDFKRNQDRGDENGYNSSDFKRNMKQDHEDMDQDGDEDSKLKLNEKADEYIRDLLAEKIKLNSTKFPISVRLLDEEEEKVQSTGRIPRGGSKYVDVYREKPVRVAVKVLVPLKEHPKFNFVGKLLGPKGNTMKFLQEETMCKMSVLGRGSMRDRQKEEELRNSLDPKYAHLSDELHVEISALAPPAEAHARIAYALTEIKKYLQPDTGDMIRQSQMRDIIDRDIPGPRTPLLPRPDIAYTEAVITKRSISYQGPHIPPPMNPGQHGPPPPRPARMPPVPPPMARHPPPPKSKALSILERARTAMDSSYGYEDPYAAESPVCGPSRAEPDYYYEPRGGQDRFYEDEGYFKETPPAREYKPAPMRDARAGRQPRGGYSRPAPYSRPK